MAHGGDRSRSHRPGRAKAQLPPTLKRVGVFLAMVLGTGAAGAALATLAAFIGIRLMRGELPGLAGLGVFLLLVVISHVAGVIIGIVATDRVIHYRGSLWLGITGSIIGVGPLAGLLALAANVTGGTLLVCLGLGPPLLGTLGYHLKRRRGGKS